MIRAVGKGCSGDGTRSIRSISARTEAAYWGNFRGGPVEKCVPPPPRSPKLMGDFVWPLLAFSTLVYVRPPTTNTLSTGLRGREFGGPWARTCVARHHLMVSPAGRLMAFKFVFLSWQSSHFHRRIVSVNAMCCPLAEVQERTIATGHVPRPAGVGAAAGGPGCGVGGGRGRVSGVSGRRG
jgi:hypothetical protein